MHLHILGICGTFMGGVAALARAAGHHVTGSDANVYPPMSDQLRALGIELYEGYSAANLKPAPDCVVVGNALSRGNPEVEALLESGLAYTSGPQWLAENVLRERWVLAVAGTHGKTTTASMLAWILEHAGLAPGFLIGGVPGNFDATARYGEAPFFVVEADEYDTAFFDKRSKFVHYRPRTLVLNNLEFDHADIFPDLAAIQRQFHHLVRTVPGTGRIIRPADDPALDEVLAQGCWSEVEAFGAGTGAEIEALGKDWRAFRVWLGGEMQGEVRWILPGEYNARNALAAILAARHAGVTVSQACEALAAFEGVRRRMEQFLEYRGARFYDDFAHHPTAITASLKALRDAGGGRRLVAALEPGSNTMRQGVHRDSLPGALQQADKVFVLDGAALEWNVSELKSTHPALTVISDVDDLCRDLLTEAAPDTDIVLLSNAGFAGLRGKLVGAAAESHSG